MKRFLITSTALGSLVLGGVAQAMPAGSAEHQNVVNQTHQAAQQLSRSGEAGLQDIARNAALQGGERTGGQQGSGPMLEESYVFVIDCDAQEIAQQPQRIAPTPASMNASRSSETRTSSSSASASTSTSTTSDVNATGADSQSVQLPQEDQQLIGQLCQEAMKSEGGWVEFSLTGGSGADAGQGQQVVSYAILAEGTPYAVATTAKADGSTEVSDLNQRTPEMHRQAQAAMGAEKLGTSTTTYSGSDSTSSGSSSTQDPNTTQ